MLTSKNTPKTWLVNLAGNVQLVDRKSDAIGKGTVIQAFGRKTGRRLLGRPRSRWKDNMKTDIK
jgi:hypothetical protein